MYDRAGTSNRSGSDCVCTIVQVLVAAVIVHSGGSDFEYKIEHVLVGVVAVVVTVDIRLCMP